jgi:hypothetical protein
MALEIGTTVGLQAASFVNVEPGLFGQERVRMGLIMNERMIGKRM